MLEHKHKNTIKNGEAWERNERKKLRETIGEHIRDKVASKCWSKGRERRRRDDRRRQPVPDGTVWQRKDDKWREDEAEWKWKEWGKRVDRSCAQGTSEACNAGGPFPIESCQRRPRQCSRLRHDKVGRRACWSVDTPVGVLIVLPVK